MAKRRLNKKVALIGSAIFVVVALGTILAILYFSRDPEKFITEGDAAWQAKDYERAEHCYHKARHLAKTDSLRKEILFKLVDMYIETDQWRFARGCWEEIINITPKDVKARYGRLRYTYIMADSGLRRAWQDVREQASEMIKVVEQANLLTDNTAKWETQGLQVERQTAGQQMGLYLYMLRGRAALEMAKYGMVTNPEEYLAQAVADLEKVLQLDPSNVDGYWYLAQAAVTKGDIFATRGNLEERDKAVGQARGFAEQAVKVADADPRAHMNLLAVKLMEAQKGGREQIEALEQEYLSLANRFPSYAEVFVRLSRFYSDPAISSRNLDKAGKAIERAIESDKNNAVYAMYAANISYRKFCYYGQKADLNKAIEYAKHALTLPDAQEETGPRSWANRVNRIALCVFLANCYIEQTIEHPEKVTEAEKAALLKEAEQTVHAIEQLLGSSEDPQVVKWQALLELAKGDKNAAIRKLYPVYEQLKAASTNKELERVDSLLAYRLAKIFENTEELGAANEFFTVALRLANRGASDKIDENKPEAFLDYTEVLLKLKVYNEALHLINFFESQYWPSDRSKILRIRAYIGAKQFDDAAEELAGRPDADSLETIKLSLELVQAKIRQTQLAIAQKELQESPGVVIKPVEPAGEKGAAPQASLEIMEEELKSYRQLEAGLVKKLLTIDPNSVELTAVIAICRHYIEQGYKAEAQDLVNRFLARFPDNTTVLVYKQILAEPNPANVSEQRRKEIEEQVLLSVADPIRRAVELGVFYRRNNALPKAAEQFKAALDLAASQGRSSDNATLERIDNATRHLFDVALITKDWQLADQITEKARRENLDDCEGNLFAARLAAMRGQPKDALVKIDECLKQKPIFSRAYVLRSSINTDLGDDRASIEDARKAASLNPTDGAIAKGLAVAFFKRDQKLGKDLPSYQMVETKTALDRAVVLNPTDLQLLSFYTEYISSTEPLRALAIRQDIQRVAPSLQNALSLGRLATKLAIEQTDAQRKEALFSVAESSYEEARKIDPGDKQVFYYYSEHLRARGMDDKAKKIMEEAKDERLLWDYYFQRGQYGDAKMVLEQLHKSNPKDISALKGLLLVAEKTSDQEAAKKYSDELVVLDGSIENHLIQIQTLLRVGLVKEAELKLQGFKEKNPDEPRAHLLDALLAMRQGQLQKALDLTNRNLQSDQNNATAWRLRGEINFYMANYEQAITDLKKAKSLSEDPLTRTSLAKTYMQIGRFDDAITELKNTIDAPGAPAEARRMLEYMYFQLGRKDALKTFYDETLAKFPDSIVWLNRAAAFATATGDLSSAEQLYKKAYLMRREINRTPDPNDAVDIQYATAFDGYLKTLVLSAGDPNTGFWNPRKLDKVFEESRAHIDGPFAPIAYLRMAEAKLRLGDRPTATDYCRKAVDKTGTNESLAAEVLLRMYLMLGPDEVSKYCEQKLKSDPRSLAANFVMFNLARINEQYSKAIEYINRCIELSGQDSQRQVDYIAKKAEVLTLAYDKTSDNNYLLKAIADYESLLAKMPNNTNVLNNLAYMLAESNQRLPEALGYAKRALDASANDASFMDTYGYVLFKNGKTSEAAEFLAAALQQYEQRGESFAPPDVFEHLGMVNEKLGAKAEALAYYKRALEAGAGKLSQKRKAQIDKTIARLSQ